MSGCTLVVIFTYQTKAELQLFQTFCVTYLEKRNTHQFNKQLIMTILQISTAEH